MIASNLSLPRAFFDAIKNTVVSVITKRLSIPASEAIRYITGGLLKSAKDLLPAIFNNTGMFAGAWELLTACAPYILAAVIIIIIAINMAKKNQLDNFIWLLGILESQQEPDVCFARISGDSLEIMIFGDEIVTELKNIPEKETQTLVVYGVDKIGIPQLQKKWTGQEIQVRGIIDEYNGKTYFKLQAYNQKTLEWINLGNISDKYQPYFLPGQSKRMKIYSISMNAQGKTKRAALFNKDMSQEEIDKCLIFDLSATTK